MADATSTVWVDSTFIDTPSDTQGDVKVEVYAAEADNIGSYSVPVVFKTSEAIPTEDDMDVEYFLELTSVSGLINVAHSYFNYEPPKIEGVYVSLVEYTASSDEERQDGYRDIVVHYHGGFPPVSGTLSKKVVFTAGKQVLKFDDVPAAYGTTTRVSGSYSYDVNYSNFSGNINNSGIAIPFYDSEVDVIHEYGGFSPMVSGASSQVVAITFAGWVYTALETDIYSALLGYKHHYDFEVTSSGGGIDVNYLHVFSSTLTTSGVGFEIYCSLVDMAYADCEVETTNGRITYHRNDVYSTYEEKPALTMDIDLFSIKITNFSLDVEEYTDAGNYISVDVLDDECPVSVSGTYFMVDGVRVPVTLSGVQDGYRMYYNPEDNFSSIEGPTAFTAHVENECGKFLEQDFYLTFGYVVEYDNSPGSRTGMDYGFKNKVAVRVTAENYASCPQVGSLAWDFESKQQFNNDLGASIVGRAFDTDISDLPAEIQPHSTAYFYGKEFEVVVNAKDFAGNKMTPLILTYRIENKPEN